MLGTKITSDFDDPTSLPSGEMTIRNPRPSFAKGVAAGAKTSADAVTSAVSDAGSFARDASYFAGALASGSIHSAMGMALCHASTAIEAAISAGKHAASKAVPISKCDAPRAPSAPMKFAKGVVGIGIAVAVEGYPLWSALAAMASSREASFAPGGVSTMNSSPLPMRHAIKVGSEIHQAQAQESFSKLRQWRADRLAASAVADADAPWAPSDEPVKLSSPNPPP